MHSRTSRSRTRTNRLSAPPPTVLVLGGIASVQFGSALAKTLFDDIGPGGAVMLRVVFAALILVAVWRPSLAHRSASDLWLAGVFGFTLAAMNLTFYLSLDRIPLGAAVTCEFVGPLGVAVFGSRRPLDLLWVALAAGGILLLAAPGGNGLNAGGVALALLAGGFWAAYILLTVRVGRVFPGARGLAIAMAVAAVLTLPIGIADGGSALWQPEVLAAALGVAVLSSVIPYSLEMQALRRLPAAVFGVLMSLEPAAAAIAGVIVLGEVLGANEWAGMLLVIAASAGATLFGSARAPAARLET
jgi:inner membrane transporter RhtA